MKKTFLIFTLLLYLTTFMVAQTQLTKYQPGVTAEGAVYYLPKTSLQLTVMIEKTSYQPGEFCNYAQRYLNLNDVVQEPTVNHRIVSVSIRPVAVADTSKAYSVKFNPLTAASNIRLNNDGILLAINADPLSLETPEPFSPALQEKLPDPRKFMNVDIISAGNTAKMAELTASEIYDLRENHNLLIKGQADFMPKDGEQLRLMLNQLELKDRSLTSLFAGTTTIDTTVRVFNICPTHPIQKEVLFRMTSQYGLVDADDLSGRPFYISVEDLHTVAAPQEPDAKKKKFFLMKSKEEKQEGIYINVPGKMRVTIYDGIMPISTSELPAPQFGNVELLSGSLFNKHFTTHLTLNPLTGAMERLDAELPKK